MKATPVQACIGILFTLFICRGLADSVGGPLFNKDAGTLSTEKRKVVIPSLKDWFKFDSKVTSMRVMAHNSGTFQLVVLRKTFKNIRFNYTVVATHEIKIKGKQQNKEVTINGLNIDVKKGDVVGFYTTKKNFFKFREIKPCAKKAAAWKTQEVTEFSAGDTLRFRRVGEPKIQCREYPVIVNYNVPPCGPLPMDIYFVVDISKSINDKELESARGALSIFLDNLEISKKDTHVGIIKYNSETVNEFPLGDFNTREEFEDLLQRGKVKGQKGGTRTDLGMEMMMEDFRQKAKNDRGQVCILMTDGKATATDAQMNAMIANLENTNILTLAIGIGSNVDTGSGRAELESIATGKGDKNVYMVSDFEALKGIAIDVMQGVCDNINDYIPPKNPTPIPTTPLPTTTPVPTTTPTPTLEPPVCVGEPLDLFLVVDISKSINKVEIQKERDAIELILEYIDVGKDASRVGLIKYHREAEIEFGLDEYTSNKQLEGLKLLTRGNIKGGTRTDLAMNLMMDTFAADTKTGRKRACILLTDGRATAPLKDMINKLETTDIKTIAVGIGGDVDEKELRSIATGDGNENVYTVNTFEQLNAIAGVVVSESCK